MVSPAIASASTDIMTCLVASYRNERGVHAETVIGGAAALAGELALRAMEPRLPDHGWVTSEKTGHFIFGNGEAESVGLWVLLREGALEAGAEEAQLPNPLEVVRRVAGAVGGSPFPPLSVPDRHYPHEWSPNACPRFRSEIERIFKSHSLGRVEGAVAVVMAISQLMKETMKVLPPAVAATLALEIMAGVSHMAPLKQPV